MTELYLGCAHYDALVERLIPVAGAGSANQIKAVLGPIASDRMSRLADVLASLDPCPVTGLMTDNQIKIALGEFGDVWPRSIYGEVVYADQEEHPRTVL
jgi:hypothetical protein